MRKRGCNLTWLVVSAVVVLSGCVFGPDAPDHEFTFSAVRESPDIEVLNYKYGNSRLPGVQPSDWALQSGRIEQETGVHGPMLRGEFLYVKWRVKQTGQVYEDRVDLRHRLPADLTDCEIHFVVKGTQLYVYVISPEKVSGHCPEDAHKAYMTTPPQDYVLLRFCDEKITQIYPEQPKS